MVKKKKGHCHKWLKRPMVRIFKSIKGGETGFGKLIGKIIEKIVTKVWDLRPMTIHKQLWDTTKPLDFYVY